MLYLTGVANPLIRSHIAAGRLGLLNQPRAGYVVSPGPWAADNGCFNAKTYVGDDVWFKWLVNQRQYLETCLFATAPDVMGDHDATLVRSLPWLRKIRGLGYKAAFVLQDGVTPEAVPWDECDAVFVGGTTVFKMDRPLITKLVREAKSRGKWVHMGRVNSRRRSPVRC